MAKQGRRAIGGSQAQKGQGVPKERLEKRVNRGHGEYRDRRGQQGKPESVPCSIFLQ